MNKYLCVGVVGVLLCGCSTTKTIPVCAGFTPPPVINKPAALVANEPDLSRWVLGTDLLGKEQGCW